MIAQVFSWIFLFDGILIGLGAFGHARQALKIHAALDALSVAPNVDSILYFVWYFASGCMLLFGIVVVWTWFRLRAGETGLLPVAALIGALYVATGIGGALYRHVDALMLVFFVLGALLLLSCWALRNGLPH